MEEDLKGPFEEVVVADMDVMFQVAEESVGTNVTSRTETYSHRDESKIRPRTVKVRTPADQDWHEAKGRPRPGARINPRSGRIPGRPNVESEYLRPNRAK